MWLWMSNKCEILCKNSKQLLRKWQKTLGDTFFAAHCTVWLQYDCDNLLYEFDGGIDMLSFGSLDLK